MQRSFRSQSAAIVPVLIVAVAARLYGIGWGLPHVYEEAKPLKVAWQMWGWGPDASFDANPHFFNYPSFSFYAQLAGQAALYAGMRIAGVVRSTQDFRIRYYTDPTPFYWFGRLIGLVFGALTVLFTYRLGLRCGGAGNGGRSVALVASALLAANLYHVTRSQMIEVDVPLTLFVVVTMTLLVSLLDAPTRARYALSGVAAGLAASTKYTGALLLPSLLAAHLLARRARVGRAGRGELLIALSAFAAAFLLASPYVAADFPAFWSDLVAERSHMRLGHFGLTGQPAWLYYTLALGNRLAGWPALVLAAAGLVYSLAVRRRAWSVVLAAFVVPYALAISSWKMTADRYALPLLPLLYVYAAAGLMWILGFVPRGRAWRTAAVAAAACVLALPVALALPAHIERYDRDSRTLCLEWLELNVPAGSFIVSEAYGPPLEGPVQYWRWPGDIRDRIYAARGGRPFYSYFAIPMFQVESDQAAAFYDIGLYREADVLITTGAVRSRYLMSPGRYPEPVAFYERLAEGYEMAERFDPSGTGPSILVYRHRGDRAPFSRREVAPPAVLRPRRALRPHWYGTYYYRMAVNYEAWNHLEQAMDGYELALPYTTGDSEVYREVVFGMTRCYALLGESALAAEFLRTMKARAPTNADLRYVEHLQSGISAYRR
jgi:4-amino-4-deoxy-L-arabinose transferase-like glycosyltransferase